MATEYTPLPWGLKQAKNWIYIVGENGDRIAQIKYDADEGRRRIAKANAKLLIAAVNNHHQFRNFILENMEKKNG
jgi:hypothetical protein